MKTNLSPGYLKSLVVCCLLALLLATNAIAGGNQTNKSFSRSKRVAAKIYQRLGATKTFYCGCSYRKKKVDHASCGFHPRKNPKRAGRIEWEHIVPAHAFGGQLPSWKKGHPACKTKKGKSYKGRRCAEKVNQQYRLMQADLYNLVPAIGEVNGDRSNYQIGIIPGERRSYGACDIEIENKLMEPAPRIRGNIARIYLYMELAYPGFGIVNKENQAYLKAWDKADPVDLFECKRAKLIQQAQGNPNLILAKLCK